MDTINEMSLNDDVTMAGGERALLAGRYRVVKQLGAGGMGSVWLVEDTTLDNKLFAVKMLPSILVSNRRAYDQLKREALVAMKLVHPGIVTLRSFEENGGNPFLVMDYIEGWTLDDFLAENGKFTEEDTVALLRPVADALDYAHSLGIVHRDIKPANIMIGKDWRPYILDFGIAREMQETMTRVTGRFSSGTLMYMSPEQLNGSRPGPSQDIYSFAATVYECLTGEPPFCRGAIEDQIKNRPPEPLDAGVAIGASVIAGLAKKAEDRPKTCAAVLEVRRRIAAPVPATKRIVHAKPHTQIPHTRMRANKEPAIPPRRCNPARKRWWLIAVAAAVLCAAAGLFFVSSGAKSNDGRKKARAQAREEDRQAVPAVVKAPAPAVKEQPPEPPEDPPEIPPEEINTDVEVLDPSPVSDMTPVPAPPSPSASVKPAPADTVRAARAPVKAKSMTNSRNPGAIGSRTGGGAEYGDSSTEVAVLKVLWWLKATQRTDGSWAAGGQKGGATSPIANTGFAILTYLAHGEYEGSESPWREDFGPVVSRAINYLVSQLDTKNPNKPVMHGSDGNEYAFLIATYALCEAYGMTRDPVCKETAMVTLQRIIDNQSPTGGWDYKMNKSSSRDDLSYAGWALQALKAGKMSGMKPDGLNDCIKKAVRCLKTRSFKSDHFAYCAGGNQHPGLTATGCLAMQLLGYMKEGEVKKSLNYMRDWEPSFTKNGAKVGNDCPSPQYYCYYATQCKYQAGMCEGANKTDRETWVKWNAAMKKLYSTSITDIPERVKDCKGKDHKQGFYPCSKGEDTWTNDVMNSCLVALQLMVYYRYLPTTSTKAAAAEAPEGDADDLTDENDVAVDVDI